MIVGSGPASWASALACANNGIIPTVIDSDNIFDPKFLKIKENYLDKIAYPNNFNLTSGMKYQKKYFFSELPYPTASHNIYKLKIDHSLYSHSSGGFSLVWGNAFLPFFRRDMAIRNWLPENILEPEDYEIILKNIPGASLNLDFFDFPLNSGSENLEIFSDSDFIINRWGGSSKIGNSSLTLSKKSCTKCGKCLDGCIFGSLFDTRSKFIDLIKHRKIHYLPNVTLQTFTETEHCVILHCKGLENQNLDIEAKNLLIGAGALSSSIITLMSYPLTEIEISDSQAVTFPVIRFSKSISKVYSHIELSDIFIHLRDKFGSLISHFQIYPINRVTKEIFKKMWLGSMNKYLSVGHMFLDPKVSGKISLSLENYDKKIIKFKTKGKFSVIFHAYYNVLKVSFLSMKRGILIIPLLNFSQVGKSYHFGTALINDSGSKKNMLDYLNDKYKSVIVIDGASLPSMPPGPPTLSIMAFSYKKTNDFIRLRNK